MISYTRADLKPMELQTKHLGEFYNRHFQASLCHKITHYLVKEEKIQKEKKRAMHNKQNEKDIWKTQFSKADD